MNQTPWTPEQTAKMLSLQQKLQGLGIKAKPFSIEEGPVVTGYVFILDLSESISKIIKRAEDLALATGEDKVIIQRVKDKIVIYVPNKERKIVDFKEVLHWYLNDPEVQQMILPIALGVDTSGKKVALDLAEMPHCLITGETGGGKSVFESAINCNFIYRFSSSELHLYLVDSKRLDLTLFKDLPHIRYMARSINEFHMMMRSLMLMIRQRNLTLEQHSCRNIQDYHKRMNGIESMPYVVLMLDEFGDLMSQDEGLRKLDKQEKPEARKYEGIPTVKSWLREASQIARAAGVHIIACTQRASVKVVDGDIKTNLPCRISFRFPTQTDSRTILDCGGAENLLGKGDMLVKRPGKDTLERFHGPFVEMKDIQELISNYEYIRASLGK